MELEKVDTRAGADMGRILRIVPTDKPLRSIPKLNQLDPKALAKALDTPNGTVRDMVMQEIFFRPEGTRPQMALALKELEFKDPAVRIQALATLDLIDPKSVSSLLVMALKDPDPGSKPWPFDLPGSDWRTR